MSRLGLQQPREFLVPPAELGMGDRMFKAVGRGCSDFALDLKQGVEGSALGSGSEAQHELSRRRRPRFEGHPETGPARRRCTR